MRCYSVLGFVLFALFTQGCSTQYQERLEKKILTPESVEVYDINIENIYVQPNNRTRLLKKFPFVSNQPIFDFYGKFSDEFYDKLDYRYKASPLKDVDFWKLRTNPFLEDFIYVLPTWSNKFQRVSNDLFEDVAYSYNLSLKEQEILKWWIGEGGILWIEGGIYSTRYDTFKRNGEIASKQISQKIMNKSKNLHFFDKKVRTYIYKSKKIDFVNYIPLKITFKTENTLDYFQDIQKLKIQTQNYLSTDFLPQAEYLIKTKGNKPLVSFVPYGKGGVVFIRPFEFKDKRFDGELLRWKLLYFLLNKMYLNNHQIFETRNTIVEEITMNKNDDVVKKFEKEKRFVLNNLEFEYKSSQIKKESLKLLEPVATYLKAHRDVHLLIAGYTDNIGSKRYNKNLSTKRAFSVKNALIKMGVMPAQLSHIGYAYKNPIASNSTAEGRAKNRRVEFLITQR